MPAAVDVVHLGLVPHRLVAHGPLDHRTLQAVAGARLARRARDDLVAQAASLNSPCATSTRKPSTPRSSQKRSTDVEHVADLGVAPVEVGLGAVEEVEVPLAVLHPRPRRAAEDRAPVVGRLGAVAARPVAEEVARALGLPGRGGQRGPEPRVLGRGVVGHQVDDHLEAEGVGRGDQRVGVGERAEERVDVAVVGDVVAVVVLRRGVERRDPERVDAEVAQVAAAAR